MKKLKSFIALFVISAFIGKLYATEIHYSVKFEKIEFKDFIADDGNKYITLDINDCHSSSTEGEPMLPFKTVRLIIPSDEEVDVILKTKEKGDEYNLDNLILPVQKPIITSLDFSGNEFVQPDGAIYSNDSYYPSDLVHLIRTDYIRGNKIVYLEVSPCEYNPAQNLLIFYHSIDIKVKLKSSKLKPKTAKVKNKEKFDNYLKAIVNNDEDVNLYSVIEEKNDSTSNDKLKSATSVNGIYMDCDYVIITTSALSSYFTDFIKWKRQKGLDVQLVTVENIYSHYPNGDLVSGINDNPGKIRQFLIDAYANGLEYALIAGTADVVPARYGYGSSCIHPEDYKIPTDLYYSELEGDWDYDSDIYFGEPNGPASETGDNISYGPEIFVGRLLCTTGNEIQNWIQKLLTYEKNPGNGDYLSKAFCTVSDHMQQYNFVQPTVSFTGSIFPYPTVFSETYNGIVNYNSDGIPQFPTGNNVINEMNKGYGFVSWFNHGEPDRIGVATYHMNNDCTFNGQPAKRLLTNLDNTSNSCGIGESLNGLDNLTNGNKPFIVYTFACNSAPFDNYLNVAPNSNLGAKFVNLSGKGGPIYLGNCRLGINNLAATGPSEMQERNFINLISTGTWSLGAAEANSKGMSGYVNEFHYVALSHNLIGCPETELWTTSPAQFSNVSVYDCNGMVSVSTGGVSGCTISVISMSDNGVSFQVSKGNVSGWTFVNVPSDYYVTITKHNYFPWLSDSFHISKPQISGSSTVTSTASTYSVVNPPSGVYVTWTYSSNIEQYYGGSTWVALKAKNTGTGWIEATFQNSCGFTTTLHKDVNVVY